MSTACWSASNGDNDDQDGIGDQYSNNEHDETPPENILPKGIYSLAQVVVLLRFLLPVSDYGRIRQIDPKELTTFDWSTVQNTNIPGTLIG